MSKTFTGKQVAKAIRNGLYHLEHCETERSRIDQMHYADTCVLLEDIVEALEKPLVKKMVLRHGQTPPTVPAGIYTDEVGNRVEIKWATFDQEKYEQVLKDRVERGETDE